MRLIRGHGRMATELSVHAYICTLNVCVIYDGDRCVAIDVATTESRWGVSIAGV